MLSQRIAAALKHKKLTPAQLVEATGLSKGAVSQWLNGKIKGLRAETAQAIADATGVRVEWLINGTGDMLMESQTDGDTSVAQSNHPRSAAQVISALAQLLLEADELTRAQISPLLQALITDPSRGDDIAGRIQDALGSQARNRFTPRKKAA